MQGFGVNTYKWVNAAGETRPRQVPLAARSRASSAGRRPTPPRSRPRSSARTPGTSTRRSSAATSREWELNVQMMSDDEHPELDFDPLDDTKVWPEDEFPLQPVGRMVARPQRRELLRRERADRVRHRRARRRAGLLRRQDARRPHVLLLRHAALPGRPELPAAAGQPARNARVATNQRDGADDLPRRRRPATNPHVNYEPSITAGWSRRRGPAHDERGPGGQRPADPRADPAHERLQAGRRALPALRAVGEGRPGRQPRRPARPVRPRRSRSG